MLKSKFEYYLKNMQSDELINKNRKLIHDELLNSNNKVTPSLVKKCFELLDKIWFNDSIQNFINDKNKIKFQVSEKLTKTAGYFMKKKNLYIFKLSSFILNNLFNSKIKTVKINGILAQDVTYVLIILMEHEIMHLIVNSLLKNHPLNPQKEKSGHTEIFKILVYNMYHHLKITHELLHGDVTQFEEKTNLMRNELQIGDKIECTTKKFVGIVVEIQKKYAIIKIDNQYKSCLLNNVNILKKTNKIESIDNIKKKI